MRFALIGDSTEVGDLGGRLLLPGFIEAHMHFIAAGETATLLELNIEQSIDEWIAAIHGAYMLHMEKQIGSIEVGKKADLIVLDRDIFSIDPYSIHETKVELTVLDGEVVFESAP
jgi:predicted amidohydrolase YtcJ